MCPGWPSRAGARAREHAESEFAEWIECGACLVWDRRGGRRSGRDGSAYLVRQLDAWEAANGGVWVDPDGGLEDDFDDMGVASWDGGAWNDDGA